MSRYNPTWGLQRGTTLHKIDEPAQKSPSVDAPVPDDKSRSIHIPVLAHKSPIQAEARHPVVFQADTEIEVSRDTNVYEHDVYATSFVPSVLRTINQLCAQVIPTQPRHCIDYTSYTRTFIGTSLIPVPIFHSSDVESQGIAASSDLPLTETSYHNFFVSLVNLECAAKEHENESHMLFQVPLQRIDIPLDGHIWALSLPGLREDSPLLEMGDVLQIRQLWVDHTGHSPSPFHGYVRSPYEENVQIQRWWTGVQYDGSIHAINRAKEMIYIRINELEYLYNGYGTVPMIANVVIPLNTVLIKSQNRAVAAVSTQLRRAMQTKNGNNHKEENNYMDEAVVNGHHELETNDWARRILFPTQADGQVQTRLRNVPHRALFDHAINYEQAHAVNDVCTEVYGTLPYLISGPPGTGKTKTVVEIAMQLLNTTDIAHVLICAPSEAAADTLALRLKEYLDVKQLFRLNRPGRADNEVPGGLLQYCCMKGDMFYLPPFKTLMAFNIVVTSCRDAAILAEARLSNDDLWTMERNMDSAFHPESPLPTRSLHWGALLIDEAAQATEIEALPALSIIIPPTAHPLHLSQPRFVMAGDERQLGPRTSSQDPKVSQSLFVRLSNRPLYATHPLSRYNIEPSSGPPVLKKSMLPMIYPPFTNLIRNYRSHPAILSVPSALFYNNTLIPEHHILSTPLQDSPLWRGRKWPVLFLPHTGADEIERENGGWYNLSEARLACSLAQSLYKSNVKQQDICIISPFAAQVKLLRSVIRSSRYGEGSGLWDVNIGPLEAFQGLEKRVVVLCTTRTRERFLDMDRKSGLGVVFQPRRMNVALTRAMEGLIVIGHPGVLGRDEYWRAWMAFCWRNGLVGDEGGGVWEGPKEGVEEKVGVLERSLVARGERGEGGEGKLLGKGVGYEEGKDGYEEWVESLREALEQESVDEDGLEDGGVDDDDDVEGSSRDDS